MTRVIPALIMTTLFAAMACAEEAVPVRVGVFPQEIARTFTTEQGLPDNEVDDVFILDGAVTADTDGGFARFDGTAWTACDGENPRFVLEPGEGGYRLEPRREGETEKIEAVHRAPRTAEPLAVGAAEGLFLRDDAGLYAKADIADGQGRHWAVSDVRGVALDAQGRLWFATLAGAGCRGADGKWTFYTGAEGLPYTDITCMAAGADGSVWFGTTKGAIRFKDGNWSYRQGRRWTPDDDIRALAVDDKGQAWLATSEGVGLIGYQPMTLAEKAAFYNDELDRLIKRTEYGYTSEVGLRVAGDKSTVVYTDSDNDGLWTGMYGAAQAFAVGATKDPAARIRAKKAFEAMRFLQTVTQMSEARPPRGYVARTILPGDGPDPNKGRIEGDREHREKNDRLWKVYEPRWPKTTDGKWYWKSDTSSDELDGHYFFYPAYYDYVAETEEEREAVRAVVRDLTDHLVDNGFYLMDHDGTPTRWSVYGPDALNNDPNWWSERGLKSLSLLSYLAAAEHVTGDQKYAALSRELVEKHAYRANAMFYKVHFGPGSGNQSDDEMAFMCFYNLMKYGKDEALKKEILYSFYSAWTVEQPEMNPFFNFCYAAFGRGATYDNPWGTHGIAPWTGWLADSVATLIDFPLDRVNWGHQNSHRADIVMLPRQQAMEPYEQGGARMRGHRVNGRVLPVSERFFGHWNTDPWQLNYGGNGHELCGGTVFLLPYYMGLLHGFIAE